MRDLPHSFLEDMSDSVRKRVQSIYPTKEVKKGTKYFARKAGVPLFLDNHPIVQRSDLDHLQNPEEIDLQLPEFIAKHNEILV